MGYEQNYHLLHLIDFGLAKKYIEPKTGEHIAAKSGKSLLGKPAFTSLNSHEGLEMSRRDDLESLAYVLLYMLKGCLPWTGPDGTEVAANKYDQISRIYEAKKSFNFADKTPGDVPQGKFFFLRVEIYWNRIFQLC